MLQAATMSIYDDPEGTEGTGEAPDPVMSRS